MHVEDWRASAVRGGAGIRESLAAFLGRAKGVRCTAVYPDAEQALEGYRVKTITLPSDVPVAAGLTMTQPTVIKQYFDDILESYERKVLN